MDATKQIDTARLNAAVKDFADYMEERYSYVSNLTSAEKRKGIDPKFETLPVFNKTADIVFLANGLPAWQEVRPDCEDTHQQRIELTEQFTTDWNSDDSRMLRDILKSDLLLNNPDAKRILDIQNKFVILNYGGPVTSSIRTVFCEVAGVFGAKELRDFSRSFKSQKARAEMELGLK